MKQLDDLNLRLQQWLEEHFNISYEGLWIYLDDTHKIHFTGLKPKSDSLQLCGTLLIYVPESTEKWFDSTFFFDITEIDEKNRDMNFEFLCKCLRDLIITINTVLEHHNVDYRLAVPVSPYC